MSKQKINPEDFLKDINNILEMASKIDNLDDKKTDIINLSKKIKKKTKILKNKYKDLDTEK
jgi:hypothetical protein